MNDNTEIKRAELNAHIELQRREIITDYLECALWEYNIKEKCQYQYKKLDGKWMENKEPIRNFRETVVSWGLIHPDDLHIFYRYCDSLERGESDFSYDMRMMGDSGKFIWIRYTGKAVFDENGEPVSVLGVTYDLSRGRSSARAGFVSSVGESDPPAIGCLENMRVKFDGSEKGGRAVVLIDADDFKYINDSFGRVYGDWLLEQIELKISQILDGAEVGRLGGDQFAALYCGDLDTGRLRGQLEDMRSALAEEKFDKDIRLSVSVGAAVCESGGESFHALLHRAETALYLVKQSGKSGLRFYSGRDENSMPPDCRQIKFAQRHDGRSPLYISKLRTYEKRLFDFAFRTLNSTDDFYAAVRAIFAELGKQYGIDEITLAHKCSVSEVKVPVIWRSTGAETVSKEFEKHVNRHWERLCSLITPENRLLVCGDVKLLKDGSFFTDERYKMNTKSVLICGIFDGDSLAGFISFDLTMRTHEWSETEISLFYSSALLISMYMLRYLSKKNLQNEILYSTAILENKDMLGYTIDPKTYEITYATHHVARFFDNLKLGDKCYKAIMGANSPCKNCPAAALSDSVDKNTVEIYNRYCGAWFSATATKMNYSDGRREYLLCLTDVTQFMDRVQSHDRLTGLLTFDKFEMECIKRPETFSGKYFAAVIKVVRFGDINDDFGFDTGNAVLKEIAAKFSKSVSGEEMICRSSGANFFALLKADVYWQAEDRLRSLFSSIEESVSKKIPELKFCMAAGLYHIVSEDKQFNVCLDRANYALKKITNGKFVSRDEILSYNKSLNDEVSGRREIERSMYSALNNGEFQVYYQPKVDLSDERVYGAEALVRWIKPDGRIISPGAFVPVFEENEFIREMDFYVYETVMRDMRRMMNEGMKLPVISLNVSRQHFFGDDFPEKLCRLVNKYGIPHENIELELTETAFFSNIDHMINIIDLLRNRRGFRISVDDFGSGYSSLNLISVLPVDVLKIDGKFFMSNEISGKNKKVIEAILRLAATLDFDTVSEGVETKEQIDFLKKTNCNAVQGYFYYKPMRFKDFKELISDE